MNKNYFRGKDIETNNWVYGYHVYTFELGYNSQGYDDVPMRYHYIFTDKGYHEVHFDTVCQYTGMMDRNNNKIFELDIVEYENSIGYIEWNKQELEYVIVDKIESLELKLGRYFTSEIEITSNIIDNPNIRNVRGD